MATVYKLFFGCGFCKLIDFYTGYIDKSAVYVMHYLGNVLIDGDFRCSLYLVYCHVSGRSFELVDDECGLFRSLVFVCFYVHAGSRLRLKEQW